MTVHDWTLVCLRVGAWALVAVAGWLVIWWGGWDVVLIARGQIHGNSISQAAMRQLYAWHPGAIIAVSLTVGILLGVLLGHFGWAQTRNQP